MKQQESINKLKGIFPQTEGLVVAILYGSCARCDASVNSDIDVQIVTSEEFRTEQFKALIRQEFNDNGLLAIHEVTSRSKIVIYFKSMPKIEFSICESLDEIKRNYVGSSITDYRQTILFERNPNNTNLELFLSNLVCSKEKRSDYEDVNALIDKFIYEFESCSNMHRRSDGYQFYFFYNIALHVAIQLHAISKGKAKFNFLPKYFLASTLSGDEQKEFYEMSGSLFLPDANSRKRKLLDFFYLSIEKLVSMDKMAEIKSLCEWFYNRDFFWNFRDVSTHNVNLKSGLLYRTATLSVFQDELQFGQLIKKHKIKTIIDLRADREIKEKPYYNKVISDMKYIKCQLDPWNQPQWFISEFHHGTNEDIAYRYFAIGCRDKIKSAFEAILAENSGATAIHCFAGKDRTGIFVSLIHLLSGASIDTVYTDYLASEVDVKLNRLQVVLDVIDQEGGIETYLKNCGLSADQLTALKIKLFVNGSN